VFAVPRAPAPAGYCPLSATPRPILGRRSSSGSVKSEEAIKLCCTWKTRPDSGQGLPCFFIWSSLSLLRLLAHHKSLERSSITVYLGTTMAFQYDPHFTSWGPFINHDTYVIQGVSREDIITTGVAYAIVSAFAVSTAYVGYKQTKRTRQPWKSAYIWMVWLEWAACVSIATESLLYILRVIRPSFYFYMSLCRYRCPIKTELFF